MTLPPGVRAVFFDAVGTLIQPEPSPGRIYAEIGRRFGSRLDAAEVRRRFGQAFADQERLDAATDHRTDEARERQRWQAIVERVLDDVEDRAGCFEALYEHFAQATAWRVEAGAGVVLRALEARGLLVGVASNFDHRLRGVLGGLSELAWVRHLLISSEVGWKKPAREFFDSLCRGAALAPSQVLLVGDDPDNDYAGARAAGMHALLFDTHRRTEGSLASLAELLGK